MLTKIKNFIKRNKVLSLLVAIILIGLILFLVLRKGDNDNPRYILEKVVRSDLKTTVTATGQVESLNSIEIKPEASGIINYVAVSDGQFVRRGGLIASIDCRDQKIALENAKLSLAKLTTADTLSVMREENDLENIYENSWNDITSFVSDINNILIEMEDFYASDGFLGYNNISTVKATGREEVSLARQSFKEADKKFDVLLEEYKSLTKLSNREDIFSLLEETRDTADTLSLAIKKTETASILIINYKDGALGNTSETEIRNIVSGWLLDVNNYANLLGTDIKSIKEAEQSLSETKAGGADELDVKSAELSVESKQLSYNKCFTRAPFDGVITNLTAKPGQSLTSYGTLMTEQKITKVFFNEVDIISIKEGQNANLTFDAIPDLELKGVVSKVNLMGEVSSGVVSYQVEITFEEEDNRVKAGMSVNVEIITEDKENILIIPVASVNLKNGKSFVQILEQEVKDDNLDEEIKTNSKIIEKEVVTGISNDTKIEIISGLEEGQEIISKIITDASFDSKMPDYRSMMSAGHPGGGGFSSGGMTR